MGSYKNTDADRKNRGKIQSTNTVGPVKLNR